jgi:hypothetical protein
MTRFSRRLVTGLATFVLLTSSVVLACNIPVFRFALERWQPDPSEVIVFFDADLPDDDAATVKELETASSRNGGQANLQMIRCDLRTNQDQELQNLWLSTKEKTRLPLPAVVIRSLKGHGQTINYWRGRVSELRRDRILESPIRSELTRRLQSGDAVVWLLVTSTDKQKTVAARKLLDAQCQALPREIELPEGIGLPGSELYSEVPLLLQFSVLEINREDAQEQYLIQQFSGFQADAFAEGEPLIVPVFGRGRALEVIPASQLSAELIQDLTRFLCGACSCQVKEQNPGFDLMLTTNWHLALFGEDAEGPPPEAAQGAGQKRAPELVPIPSGRKKNR